MKKQKKAKSIFFEKFSFLIKCLAVEFADTFTFITINNTKKIKEAKKNAILLFSIAQERKI